MNVNRRKSFRVIFGVPTFHMHFKFFRLETHFSQDGDNIHSRTPDHSISKTSVGLAPLFSHLLFRLHPFSCYDLKVSHWKRPYFHPTSLEIPCISKTPFRSSLFLL